jgi:hypothetical protein
MDKRAELKQWIEIADSDLDAANHLAKNMRPAPYEIVCFHCQQAAEKYLKWFLVEVNDETRNRQKHRSRGAGFSDKKWPGTVCHCRYERLQKTQAAIKLITELAKGKRAREEQGWLSAEDLERDLGIHA